MTLLIGEPRKMKPVTQVMLNRQMHAITEAWNRREYLGRLTTRYRELYIIRSFSNKVYPDIPWFTSLMDSEQSGSVVEEFAQYCSRVDIDWTDRANIDEVYMSAVFAFSAMKCLSKSDSSPWFRLENELAFSLLSTHLRGVKAGDVVFPFPGFYVELPAGLISLFSPDCGLHEMRTICVCEGVFNRPSKDKMARSFSELSEGDWKATTGRKASIICFGEGNESSLGPRGYSAQGYVLTLHDDSLSLEDLGKGVSDVVERHSMEVSKANDYVGTVLGSKVVGHELEKTVLSFVVNFLLYLSSKDADILPVDRPVFKVLRKKKKSAMARRKIKALQDLPDFIVGSRVVIDPRVRQTMQSSAAVGGISKAVNVLVRGHWRHVWHGKKTEESPKGEGRRPVWVQPFVRNKATGAVLGHQYEVR
jgi:hypothetical protein